METMDINNDLIVKCTDLINDDKFPIDYTGYGKNMSPEFIIDNLSPFAKSFIITLEDLDHPIKNFTHWIIWNIPASSKIPGNIPKGRKVPFLNNAIQGISYGFHRYAGPKPPINKTHKYCFTIYVLDAYLNLNSFSLKSIVLSKAQKHILQKGTLYSFYK